MCRYEEEIDEIFNILNNSKIDVLADLRDKVKHTSKICIFGAGFIGKRAADIINLIGRKVDFFCDNDKNKWNKIIYNDIICKSPGSLKEYGDDLFLIIATNSYNQMIDYTKKFQNSGVLVDVNDNRYRNELNPLNDKNRLAKIKEDIKNLLAMLEDDRSKETLVVLIKRYSMQSLFHQLWEKIYYLDEQYYPMDIVHLSNEESFVDCGAFNGDSMLTFFKKVNYEFKEFFGFELEKENYDLIKEKYNCLDNNIQKKIMLFNKGVWDEKTKFQIEGKNDGSSKIIFEQEENNFTKYQEVDSIDNLLLDKEITYIKMDIEGAELKALKGAKGLIIKNKPKLAISIYHKVEDIWAIPLYIKSIEPSYKIYLRHHTFLDQDTVCYAIK